jgi:hypothetical protein
MRIKFSFTFIFLLIFAFFRCNLSDNTENLGEGYFYRNEGETMKDILCDNSNGGQIPATVLSYDYDKNYIIAKQKPKLPQEPLYDKNFIYKYGNKEIYYWLIIKNERLVLGPYNLGEFNDAKIKYNVSDKLMLK